MAAAMPNCVLVGGGFFVDKLLLQGQFQPCCRWQPSLLGHFGHFQVGWSSSCRRWWLSQKGRILGWNFFRASFRGLRFFHILVQSWFHVIFLIVNILPSIPSTAFQNSADDSSNEALVASGRNKGVLGGSVGEGTFPDWNLSGM